MSGSDISIKIKNYRCFQNEFSGFDKIVPVNIIIGRNNSGKSALLDLLEFATDISKKMDTKATIQIEEDLTETELKQFTSKDVDKILNNNDSNNDIPFLKGLRIRYEITEMKNAKFEWVEPKHSIDDINKLYPPNRIIERKRLFQEHMNTGYRIPLFFKDKVVRRILADRDIKPESFQYDRRSNMLRLTNSGEGATNIISTYILDNQFDHEIVQKKMLDAFNEIFGPENIFQQITSRFNQNSSCELFFGEKQKGLISMSMSGSGLKTVILVLLNLIVMPLVKLQDSRTYPIMNHLFAFEELENNLHPAVLRRLLAYIERFAIENNCYFFITTHSSVVVDQFSQSPNAQIIHVTHDGKQSRTTAIASYDGQNAILDDIGAKASDLLQANGIVWLEGPSDRIYLNKWIEIYSGGTLREHRDYEFAFYGGSVLKHFTADEPASKIDAINVLRVNRNAVLISDSDKISEKSPLKPRVEKMKAAMEEMKAYTWITEAKEVENYIPVNALGKKFGKTGLPEIGQYEDFHHEISDKGDKQSDYWHKNILSGSFDKVELARDIVPHLNKETLSNRFDLEKQMGVICDLIRKWNR